MQDHSSEWPILVVTKDIAEFLIYSRVVEALRKLGYRVYVIAEGLSMRKWTDSGEMLYGGVVDLDLNGFRHDIDVPRVFGELNPSLVLTGLGSPINLGEKFGIEANRRGVKLGYIEDIWGVHRRSGAVPNFICTVDPYGDTAIRRHVPYRDKGVEVHVTGNPALDRLRDIDPCLAGHLGISSYDVSILIAGQDESTTPVIEGLSSAVRALENEGERVLVIPRLHPKFKSQEALWSRWLGMLHDLGQICTVMWVPTEIEISHLAGHVDFVVSIYSNALIEAAVMGAVPVSWMSPVGQDKMYASIGETVFPMVTLNCAAQVWQPGDFINRVENPHLQSMLKATACGIYRISNSRTESAVNAIKSHLR